MKSISQELKEVLVRQGADLVGIGKLEEIPAEERKYMPYGIAVAVSINPNIIKKIENGPTMGYFDEYNRLNDKLDTIVLSGADFLKNKGFQAIAQTREVVSKTETEYSSVLPHKTIATRAGLGWIGKNAMLVTETYGNAVRISAILTDAPLEADHPVTESKCKNCMACTKACPGEAVQGTNWNIHKNREELFDPIKCRKAARKISKELLDKEITLCGKCIEICPYTKKYVKKAMLQE